MSIKTVLIFLQILVLNIVAFPISAGQELNEEQKYTVNVETVFDNFVEEVIEKPLNREEKVIKAIKKMAVVKKDKESSIKTRTSNETSVVKNYTWTHLVNRIKKRENLELKPYICPAGFLTVGYGHTIKSADRKSMKDIDTKGVNSQQADSLLTKDLNYCKNWVKQNLHLEGHKLMAITNFCYAFGTTKLRKSQLYKKIKANQPIDTEIRRWVHINGHAAKNLITEREFELALYNAK